MSLDPYTRFKSDELILRDYLAADRTVLANERTLLAYIRTAIAFAAAGAALLHFFDSTVIEVAGMLLIPVAVVTLLLGLQRYVRMKRRLSKISEQ